MTGKKISLDESFKIAVDFHTKGKISEAKNIYEKIKVKLVYAAHVFDCFSLKHIKCIFKKYNVYF